MFVAAMLTACGESEVSVDYKLSAPVTLEMYTESYYATLDLKGEEKMGTITATYADLNYSSKGDTTFVKRNYVIDKSRGYLKNFMPTELASLPALTMAMTRCWLMSRCRAAGVISS